MEVSHPIRLTPTMILGWSINDFDPSEGVNGRSTVWTVLGGCSKESFNLPSTTEVQCQTGTRLSVGIFGMSHLKNTNEQ